jgi:hypothetical protein
VAEDPRTTLRELRELVVAYAKQETVEPLKGLGRYVGFGVAGALLMGTGIVFVAIGALRALQGWGEGGRRFNGNMSWAPYVIVLAGASALAGLVWTARGKQRARASKRASERNAP